MADGSTKKIEDVRLGDKVVATDPSTGESGAEPVTALITGIGVKQMVTLTVDAGGAKGHQTATITATDGHPFWVADLGRWKTAGELKAGAMLQTGPGTYATITATKAWTAPTNKSTTSPSTTSTPTTHSPATYRSSYTTAAGVVLATHY